MQHRPTSVPLLVLMLGLALLASCAGVDQAGPGADTTASAAEISLTEQSSADTSTTEVVDEDVLEDWRQGVVLINDAMAHPGNDAVVRAGLEHADGKWAAEVQRAISSDEYSLALPFSKHNSTHTVVETPRINAAGDEATVVACETFALAPMKITTKLGDDIETDVSIVSDTYRSTYTLRLIAGVWKTVQIERDEIASGSASCIESGGAVIPSRSVEWQDDLSAVARHKLRSPVIDAITHDYERWISLWERSMFDPSDTEAFESALGYIVNEKHTAIREHRDWLADMSSRLAFDDEPPVLVFDRVPEVGQTEVEFIACDAPPIIQRVDADGNVIESFSDMSDGQYTVRVRLQDGVWKKVDHEMQRLGRRGPC